MIECFYSDVFRWLSSREIVRKKKKNEPQRLRSNAHCQKKHSKLTKTEKATNLNGVH